MEFESGSHHESHEAFTGTKDETEARCNTAADFLKQHLIEKASLSEKVEYDGVTELHFSGGDPNNYSNLRKGTALLKRIEGVYKDGALETLHVIVSPGPGLAGNTDVYISGRALEDYLAAESQVDERELLPPEKQ